MFLLFRRLGHSLVGPPVLALGRERHETTGEVTKPLRAARRLQRHGGGGSSVNNQASLLSDIR